MQTRVSQATPPQLSTEPPGGLPDTQPAKAIPTAGTAPVGHTSTAQAKLAETKVLHAQGQKGTAVKSLVHRATQQVLQHKPDLAGPQLEKAIQKILNDPKTEIGAQFQGLVKVRSHYENISSRITKLKARVIKELPDDKKQLTGHALHQESTRVLTTPPAMSSTAAALAKLKLQASVQEEFAKIKSEVAPSREEIENTWDAIVENDRATNGKITVSEESIATNKAAYLKNVNNWLNDIDALQQIAQQKLERATSPITVMDMRPGDIFVRKEVPPQSMAHSTTLPKQMAGAAEHNGIEKNKGHTNCFHAGQWVNGSFPDLIRNAAHECGVRSDEMDTVVEKFVKAIQEAVQTGKATTEILDILLKETDQIAEARGGLGTTNALRVLVHSLQSGEYTVYRPKEMTFTGVRADGKDSLTAAYGDASSVIAEVWANVQPEINKTALKYSTAILGGSMLPGGALRERTAAGDQDAINLAANPEKMIQEIDMYSVEPLNSMSTADFKKLPKERQDALLSEARSNAAAEFSENQHYFDTREKDRKGGETCSTFVVRTAQTGTLQMAVQQHIFALAADLRNQGFNSQQISARIQADFSPNPDGSMKPLTKAIFDQALDKHFKGLLDNKAEGVSPRTVEHFCKDESLFEFVGVLTMLPEDVLSKEQNFDLKTGLPKAPRFAFEQNATQPATSGSTAGDSTVAGPSTAPLQAQVDTAQSAV